MIKALIDYDAPAYFGVEGIRSPEMDGAIQLWQALESGDVPWVHGGDDGADIRTISFGNTVARELASLIALNVDVKCEPVRGDGMAAALLQSGLDSAFMSRYQPILERMIRIGGVMCKWNGTGLDVLGPDRFLPTETDSAGNITACVFLSHYADGDRYYTRAEWHRYGKTEDDGSRPYLISNKAFVSDTADMLGREISLAKTKWRDIQPEARIDSLERPLYVYLRNPYSNTISPSSPLGVSILAECTEELRWLDIAMSTLGTETEQSRPMLYVDESAVQIAERAGIRLPSYVMGLGMGITPDTTTQQWQPRLQIADRKEGINFYLSLISYKCGFDPGYFVFDGSHINIATATQVEATERRTVNTVTSYRNLFDRPTPNGTGRCGYLHDIAYMINAMQVAGGDVPYTDYGNYELYADFADITANTEEDRAFDFQLSQAGYIPKWQYLVRHAGMTEDEAKDAVAQAQAESMAAGGLFADEA